MKQKSALSSKNYVKMGLYLKTLIRLRAPNGQMVNIKNIMYFLQ